MSYFLLFHCLYEKNCVFNLAAGCIRWNLLVERSVCGVCIIGSLTEVGIKEVGQDPKRSDATRNAFEKVTGVV